MTDFVSVYCQGERCGYRHGNDPCGFPADHKVEETIFDDDPAQQRHPLTQYLCHEHFRRLMGPMTNTVRDLQKRMMEKTNE